MRNPNTEQISPTAHVASTERTLFGAGSRVLRVFALVVTLGMLLGTTSYSGPKKVSNKRVKLVWVTPTTMEGGVAIPTPPYSASFVLTYNGVDWCCVLSEGSPFVGGAGDGTPEEAIAEAVVASGGVVKSITIHKLDWESGSGWINITYAPAN